MAQTSISLALGEQEAAFIESQLKDGVYRNADEVMRAGLRLLESKEGKLAELRRMIDEADQQIADGNFIVVEAGDDLTQSIIKRGTKILSRES